jgi:dihydropteroate synthase
MLSAQSKVSGLKLASLSQQAMPWVMGCINVSPNSFYNPSNTTAAAVAQADAMVIAGADIIDIGGEATNPKTNLDDYDAKLEAERVLPVLEVLRHKYPNLPLSVDTSNPDLMRAAIALGVSMINDQRALTVPGALQAVADTSVHICLMHAPSMQRAADSTSKHELLANVIEFLQHRTSACTAAGIDKSRLIIDPGFGRGHYAKSTAENFYLLTQLQHLLALGYPVLVAWSRKSMLADILSKSNPDDLLYASLAAAILCMVHGASIIRTHDVAATVDVVKVFKEYKNILETCGD